MKPIRDPEGFEAKNFLQASQLKGKEVLEIGCGNGWLSWQYAGVPAKVFGIDPCLPDLQEAKAGQPTGIVNFYPAQSMGEGLPFPPEVFDLVVFSNSL